MKIKCPLCNYENYFTGLEDEGTKFCSECNTPLVESKIPNNIENPYIKKDKPKVNISQSAKKIRSVSDRFTNIPIDQSISISKIKDSKCPFKYYKNYIEEPKEEKPFLSIELGLGQFFHGKVEWLFKTIASQKRKITREDKLEIEGMINEFEISFLWNGKLREPYKIIGGYHFNYFKDRLVNIIQNFNRYVVPKLVGQEVISTEGSLQIKTDDFVIRGKYDLITQDQDKRLILWDWKTGKMPNPEYYRDFTLQKIQIGIYTVWIKYKYETTNIIANVVFLRDSTEVLDEVFEYHLEEKVINFVESQYKVLKNITSYAPIPNNLCPWCSWVSICRHM